MGVMVTNQSVPASRYRLRWRFTYHDGKPDRVGIWNGASPRPEDSAALVNKTNLLAVHIEAEVMQGPEAGLTKLMASCPGQDYGSMQWEAYSRIPAFFKGNGGTPRAFISGLSMLSRNEKLTVWVDGRISVAPLTETEKLWTQEEHSL